MSSPLTVTERVRTNPFYVLEVSVEASRAEIERQGQKLLSMLELKMKEALTYPTPLGPQPRDSDAVRTALAELREPNKRLVHEVFAALNPKEQIALPEKDDGARAQPELNALLEGLGLRRRGAP